MEEACHCSSTVFCCFIDFWKVFDMTLREVLFQRFWDINISKTLLTTIMRLYELVLGHLHKVHEISDLTQSTIYVKQCAPSY
jgi:hypothetical protein